MELEQGRSILQQGISAKLKNILEGFPEKRFNADEYMMLYTAVFNICQKGSEDDKQWLYNKYKETLVEYINTMVLPALRGKHGEFLLKEFVKGWDNYKLLVPWLSKFFSNLDLYFIPSRSLSGLNEVGFMCFRDQVYEESKDNICHTLIILINQEREGGKIDRALLKSFPRIFVEIGMGSMDGYENHFELAMLTNTSAYYSKKVSSWIGEYSFQDYMLKAEECLEKEKKRVGHYLHTNSGPKLFQRVQQELLTYDGKNLLMKEPSIWNTLVKDNKVEDLSRMYRLFAEMPEGLEPIAAAIMQHITTEGIALITQAEDAVFDDKAILTNVIDQTFMKNVIGLHEKYLWQVSKFLVNNNIFRRALKGAFQVFCSKFVAGSNSAELLATFCDDLLKKRGSERLSYEEIEDTIEKVVKVLACIWNIDMFAEIYRNKLASRLLFHKDDHELSILTKLKRQFGSRFTWKMESMVTDITLAEESQITFKDHLKSNSTCNLAMDFSVNVLTRASWPNFKSADLVLPAEMVKCAEVFEEFYQTKTHHRKLTWIHSMGTCAINVQFDAKMIELIVTTYQAAVLVLFNEANRLSYEDIRGQLNLGDRDIDRILHSLSCGKHKMLNKNPSTEMVTQTDSFEFNSKFTSKMSTIKIPLPPMDERKNVKADIDKDRRFVIDSFVVGIMKSRKVFPYQNLVLECTEHLGGMLKPDFKEVKKRIEDLITREYLERDKDDSTMLRYLS